MKIAILGWGSLIWDPRKLECDGAWQRGGPQLPLEFSRISSDGRLTLVIDPEHGEFVTTLYTTSSITNLEESIENLRKREGLPSTQNIGFINLINCETHTRQNADLTDRIRAWGRAKSYDAVIWTDLPPNDPEHGEAATTFYVTSSLTDLAEAIENLREREGLPSTQNIGFINLINSETHTRQNADLVERIRAWGRTNGYDAVIWTDLPPRFVINGEAAPFSADAAIAYLHGLPGETATQAREYIIKAPKEVDTPVRRKIQATSWLNEGE